MLDISARGLHSGWCVSTVRGQSGSIAPPLGRLLLHALIGPAKESWYSALKADLDYRPRPTHNPSWMERLILGHTRKAGGGGLNSIL